MEVEILLFFSLKNKRLQRTAGTSSKKKLLFQKIVNVIVKSERISRGYLFPIIGTECSTFFTDKGLLRFHRVFPSAFRDNNQ
jgi:hypothetical protein